MSDSLTSLVKKIDQKVNEASAKYPQKLGTFVVIGDAPGRADQLRDLATCEVLQHVSLCIGAAPPRYEINKDADMTVVVYTVGRPGRQQVTANFALRQGELTDAVEDAIVTAVANVLPK